MEEQLLNIRRPVVSVQVLNLQYAIGAKYILNDITLDFPNGKLHCLLGASGSGKTTLINCILGNVKGKMNGQVLFNGSKIYPGSLKSFCKLVPQDDIMLSTLTVRETLMYQASLVIDASDEEREARVDKVLEELSLETCQHTRIGTVEARGISGGQRKRTSIGMELLADPSLLCVDEPTSGLDSKTAEDVVNILSRLSRENRTVIATIHQPSFRIFRLFDTVSLLSGGQVAYSGVFDDIEKYFSRFSLETPNHENPADHYMRMLQDEETSEKLVSHWSTMEHHDDGITAEADAQQQDFDALGHHSLHNVAYPTSTMHQIKVLFRRSSLDILKDRTKFVRQMAMKLIVGLIVGTVWFRAADPPTNEKLFPLQGALFMLSVNAVINTLAQTIITFPLQRALLIREYNNGTYRLLAYYISMMTSMFLMGLVGVVLITFTIYFMVGFQLTFWKFTNFVLIITAMTCIGNALGIIVGTCANDLIEAQNMLMPVLAPLLLFSGYILPKTQIPAYLRIFYDISFFQYAITALEVNQFTGLIFTDFNIFKLHIYRTGEDFLRNALHIEPDTHPVSEYIGILFAYSIVITALGYFIVKYFIQHHRAG